MTPSTAPVTARPTTLLLPPLSLYIHIPWCVRKCPYCDFNSHQKNGELPEEEYIDALLTDLAGDLHYVQGREISSLFLGGGTPSLLSARACETLLEGLQRLVSFARDIEITMEANPGTAERRKFADFRKAGINRLSIGIQSFSDAHLHDLGRIHDSADGHRAIEFARAAGFDNLNIDIMYGLSGQSLESALADLHEAIRHEPEHVSWYQLTIEPNTEFFKRPPLLPPEDDLLEIQDSGLALLQGHAYGRYEVSAFARADRQSRHNLNYWRFGDYLGIGAGAHGKITLPDSHTVVRTRKKRQPTHYLAANRQFTAETTVIPEEELALEFLLNALRLNEGFAVQQFEAATGLGFEVIQKQVSSLQGRGLLSQESLSNATHGEQGAAHCRIRATEKGGQFLNSVLEEFL